MQLLITILPWVQIGLATLLVAAILIQQSEAGLGATFGGSSMGNSFHTKRGLEKTLFIATIILAALFIASTLIRLII